MSTPKAYVVQEPFGLDALTLVERPAPEPGPGQVLVQMHAVSLNYRDLLVIRGVWRPKEPRIPGSDGVGEVVATGEGVTRVQSGDRVAGIFYPGWIDGPAAPEKLQAPSLGGTGADGTLAELAVFDEEAVVKVPEHLSDEEAATLPLAGVTAWHAVVTRGGVKEGDTVLVQGTGGVSLFALQFARMMGASVIVTSSSEEKLRRALRLGAIHGINYKDTPAWDELALELTGNRGVDHIVEVVGAENLTRSLNAVRMSGTISVIGLLGGTSAQIETFGFVEKNVRLNGILVGSREMFEAMNQAIAEHRLKPVIDRVFGFDEVPAAVRYLEAGAHFGKVCVRMN
ncbi:MAG TPA: NAD(P)-dependent alcohol dehydrogenase [Thermoanaerobaculia bacterium]|jgi:NADPH:quinone reductase-like Zn-dependent oxidoreductase|nr:NAD(P)-dependent alcohol dehydrogenase [Thermoanaerobaculia bacterium]